MNIVLTGSLGNISQPLAQDLIKKGHQVTIISSKAERAKDIAALGAKAAIGTMQDIDFLATSFKGADIVYLMEALGHDSFFDPNTDIVAEVTAIGSNYKQAVEKAGVNKIIHLSSIGAHTDKGVGMLRFHYNVENILNQLPADVSIKFMRPVGFYYNMLEFIRSIKSQGVIATNYNAAYPEPWVAPVDIAAVIAAEMEQPFEGRSIRYIASDEKTSDEIAGILGEAIGVPNLKWMAIPDEALLSHMIAAGMNPETAKGIVEMNISRQSGTLFEHYNQHKPVLGTTKIKDFARQFAAAYHQE